MIPVTLCAETALPSAAGWIEWDVTNHVKDAILNGLTNVDFLIKMKDENIGSITNGATFHSSRGTNKPVLAIDSLSRAPSKNTWLNQFIPIGNNGTSAILSLNAKTDGIQRTVISFPINSTNIVSAKLKLYCSDVYGSGIALKW
jgi:hypothetical protein